MILRIEDTDSNRFVPGAEDYINEALAWLGIGIDEGVREGGAYGPYKQSERRDIYREHVGRLLDRGKAYIAFDTPAELEEKRKSVPNFQYDATTRGSMRNSLTMKGGEGRPTYIRRSSLCSALQGRTRTRRSGQRPAPRQGYNQLIGT